MAALFDILADKAINSRSITERDALELYGEGQKDVFGLLARASRIRHHFKDNSVNLLSSAKKDLLSNPK